MRTDVLIAGQGLAGTLLGWAFERAGIPFAIADQGHATAATRAAAGIINPITGRRLVKSWRVETLLPQARAAYREIETCLGERIWSDLRVRRLFADERERQVFARKRAAGELDPYLAGADDDGFWIQDAARVDLERLLTLSRTRWRNAGVLREERVDLTAALGSHDLVIDCTGRAAALAGAVAAVPWTFSNGEMLEIEVEGLAPDVVLNRRHWVLPVGAGRAWVGATHAPGEPEPHTSDAGRETLTASARGLVGSSDFRVTGQRAGVRTGASDKRPVAGRNPDRARYGVVNGLGAKGALWAPLLARQWVQHLTAGTAFDAEVDLRRFSG